MRQSELSNAVAAVAASSGERPLKRRSKSENKMFGELISAVCVLGIVIVGMLIMIQAITLNAIGRLLLFVMAAMAGACVLRMLLVSVVVPWLVSLKALVRWLALAAIAIIALVFVVRITVSRLQHRIANTNGESYAADKESPRN